MEIKIIEVNKDDTLIFKTDNRGLMSAEVDEYFSKIIGCNVLFFDNNDNTNLEIVIKKLSKKDENSREELRLDKLESTPILTNKEKEFLLTVAPKFTKLYTLRNQETWEREIHLFENDRLVGIYVFEHMGFRFDGLEFGEDFKCYTREELGM